MSATLKNWPDEQAAREAKEKAVVFLRDTGGYSWKQIARALNTTRGPVEQVYARAKNPRRAPSPPLNAACDCLAARRHPFIHHPPCPVFPSS